MRVLRKILSLALACALTLSMGATAWAADGNGFYPPMPGNSFEVRPGKSISLGYEYFIRESDGTPMPNITWRFCREFLKLNSHTMSKGSELVSSVTLDDVDGTIKVLTKEDFNLAKGKPYDPPNMVIKNIKLTVTKDYNDGTGEHNTLNKGDVYVLSSSVEAWVGHEVAIQYLDQNPLYFNGTITKFVNHPWDDTISETATIVEGDTYIEGVVKNGEKVYMELNYKDTYEMRKRFDDESISLSNIITGVLPRTNTVKLFFTEDSFIYRIDDGKLLPSELKYDAEENIWVGELKGTVHYVRSDKALGEVPDVKYDPAAGLETMHYAVDGGELQELSGFESTNLNYTVRLPLGFSSVDLFATLPEESKANITNYTTATPDAPIASVKVRYYDNDLEPQGNIYCVKFIDGTKPQPTPPDDLDDRNESPSTDNSANKPETTEKISDTVAALKDPKATLPAGVTKTTTAGGASISTIPVPMVSGSATVGMDLFNSIGSAPANVGVKFSVSAGLTGGSMEVIIPGGFGKITEPGRIGYSMDFSPKAENNDTMLKAVKGDNATSTTAKIGGNYTLPVTATVTVATKVADGTTINIYKYDPVTGKFITVGKAVAKDGKLTFGTKLMGEMLFTTGKI